MNALGYVVKLSKLTKSQASKARVKGMAVGSDEFKKAMQLWASGVAVVTSQSEKYGLRGMTVTAFSSVSVEPPQILVCLNPIGRYGGKY
jgi:flavin reductase (DIM6/NTAB) family NADH-FMN oxidoreductase RutF